MKRIFDFTFAFIGLIAFSWLICVMWVLAALETKRSGFFLQERVGQNGVLFRIYKVRTMCDVENVNTTITTMHDSRITKVGRYMRKWKLDELPSLWNVLCGEMSFVGPRPDVPGYADRLKGHDRDILKLRPGITGPASLKYANEEEILAAVQDPIGYNNEVIFPDKVKINLEYYYHHTFLGDIKLIIRTIMRNYEHKE
jgi:lipopolysaccharide/colanic/teichoic acid biosynthesis glycosyltransferase